MSIVAARMRSRAGQLAAIAVTAVVLSGVGVGMGGVLESGLDAAVRGAASEPTASMTVGSASADEVAPSAQRAFGGVPLLVEQVGRAVVVAPDPARVGTGDLLALRDGAGEFAGILVDNGAASRTAVAGELEGWAQELLDLSWRSRLLALVPFLVVAVGGLVAARDVVRVLALSRVTELSVTRSRGASRRRLVLGELREVAVAGAAGAVVGGVVAAATAGTPVLLAFGLVVVVPLALASVTVPVARAAIPRDRADEAAASSGRGRAAGIVGLMLLFAGAALSIWRLVSTGSAADPAGVAAPALGLLAGSLLVLLAVGAAVRLVDLASRRWRGLGRSLAVRRIARRLPMLATIVLLVAIAAASTVFASAFGATGDRIARDVRELRVGGDLLVTGWPVAADADAATGGSTALLRAPGEVGRDEPLIVLATASRLPDAVRPIGGLVDPGRLAADLAAPAPGLALPEDTTRVEVATTTTEGVVLRLWVLERSGRARSVPLDATTTIEGPIAAILGLDADVARATGEISARVTTIVATTAGGPAEVAVPTDWEPQFQVYPDFAPGTGFVGEDPRFAVPSDGLGFDLGRTARDQVAVRLMRPGDSSARVPVVVTRAFAARNGLEVGADVDVRFAGTGRYVYGAIAGIVPALPTAGDSDAVLADLPAYADQQLRRVDAAIDAPELVLRIDDPEAARAALPAGTTAVGLEPGTSDRMLGIARTLLWFAAIGSVLVAAVGVAGVSASLVAERRRETRILGVLGELPSRQARGQRLELAVTAVLAALGGVGVGILLALALVPSFARAAAPGAGVLPSVELVVDLPSAAVLLVGLGLVLAVVLIVHGVRVARSAVDRRATS